MAKEDLEDLGSPWSDTVTEDLYSMEMTWTECGEVADDRAMWKSCVAQRVRRTH